jgi:hypothetical protein
LSFYPDKSVRRQAPSKIEFLQLYGRWRKSRSQEVENTRVRGPEKYLTG